MYDLIPLTGNNAFDFFASLIFWLIVIVLPFAALVSLLIHFRRSL